MLRYDLATMFKSLYGIIAEMLSGLRRTWKLYPVTLTMVVVSWALYLVTRAVWAAEWLPWTLSESIRYSAETFGWFTDSLVVADICGLILGRDIQTVMEDFGSLGIIELWDGEIWRLPISAFHHGFPLHLIGNLFVIFLLGAMLEKRVPRLWYAAYFLASAVFSVACQALMLDACIGLSGTGYAIFGTLLVLRSRDFELRRQIPRVLVIAGILSIVVCLPLTWLNVMPIANMAHFSGFGYGLVAGWVIIARRQALAEIAFAAVHLLLIPFCWMVSDPIWNEEYVERKADILAIRTDDPAVRSEMLQFLVQKQPDNPRYRIRLVSALVQQERRDDAWECAIRGWNGTYTQSQQALIQQMQGLWKLMPNADARENAETVLEQVFGNRADAIKDKLNLDWLSVESDRMWNGPRELSADPSPPVSLQKRGPTVDETSPDSAAIGWRT